MKEVKKIEAAATDPTSGICMPSEMDDIQVGKRLNEVYGADGVLLIVDRHSGRTYDVTEGAATGERVEEK